MKFDDLDKKMRVYETADDYCVLPGIYIVVRLDGRGFTRLTKEVHSFELPYDERFRDHMVETTEHLLGCGFNVRYGYTQSDEISLLFDQNENLFSRKTRKIVSVLAGEASARFSLALRDIGIFDARISQLPGKKDVVDYFRWRNEDAFRNSLNSHCYWMLRKQGEDVRGATSFLSGMSVADKNELLFRNGINFNDLPNWQKRGVGIYWEEYEKRSENLKTGEEAIAKRRRIKRDYELPMRDEYNAFISRFL